MSIIRARGGHRPNAIPAKAFSKIGHAYSQQHNYRKDGKWRTTTTDLCDFCLRQIVVKKNILSMRLRGWRLSCGYCWLKNHKGESPKDLKIWIFPTREGVDKRDEGRNKYHQRRKEEKEGVLSEKEFKEKEEKIKIEEQEKEKKAKEERQAAIRYLKSISGQNW